MRMKFSGCGVDHIDRKKKMFRIWVKAKLMSLQCKLEKRQQCCSCGRSIKHNLTGNLCLRCKEVLVYKNTYAFNDDEYARIVVR